MCPADSFDEATADMISDGVTDLFQPLIKIYYEKDETKKVMRMLMSVSVPHSVCQAFLETANQSVSIFFLKSISKALFAILGSWATKSNATHVNRKWTFCNVTSWFLAKFLADRLYQNKDTERYKFGSIEAY